jgi:hypothetical protein
MNALVDAFELKGSSKISVSRKTVGTKLMREHIY